MKKYRLIIFYLAFILLACDEAELSDKDYPFLIIKEVSVYSEGVMFTAEVLDLGDSAIQNYGFVWGDADSELSISNSAVVTFSEELLSKTFSYNAISDFTNGNLYSVRPFASINDEIVYGTSVTFESMGSNQAQVFDYNPKTVNLGDTVFVSGEYLTLNKNSLNVYFGNVKIETFGNTEDGFSFRVPLDYRYFGEINFTIISGKSELLSNGQLYINSPIITDFNPKEGFPGITKIEILGTGFKTSNNSVKIGNTSATILEQSDTRLLIQTPYTLNAGEYTLTVVVNGRNTVSKDNFTVKSSWTQLNNFPDEARIGGYFTIVNDKGYLIGGLKSNETYVTKEVWNYNLVNDSWERSNDFPGSEGSISYGFTFGEKIIYGNGSELWAYNVTGNSWQQLNNFSAEEVKYYTLNDKGYLIKVTASGNEVWEYAPTTDTWTKLGSISSDLALETSTTLQSSNTAYLLSGNSADDTYMVYKFDPDVANFLTPIAEIPFSVNNSGSIAAFVIDDIIYTYNYSSECWTYDIDNNEWTQIESINNGSWLNSTTFTYKNLGFVMFGENRFSGLTSEIWSFDIDKY
ncbi:IPT/TIG domain-containing protein [Chondrinema litorale]|uniref:IPT/TIG domain-containing protein n=1 Tax=Chondrinema litorale TaxID=2994555 RepID=UPI002543914E|nr:IPT/TIG domain-containing protein [Chondrinema litorale]UZR99158.1 IPT/TIG domain-containing protein [Chondrinema litorale]